jgi:ComF family protein
MKIWQRPVEAGLNIVFPHCCVFCRRVCEQNPTFPGVCRHCLPKVPFRKGRQTRLESENNNTIYCATWYSDPIRSAVLRLKFADSPEIAATLAAILLQCWRQIGLDCLAVAAVPLHTTRLRERGYNQAALLAAELADHLERPDWSDRIVRIRPTERQSSLPDRTARSLNLCNSFAMAPDTRLSAEQFNSPDLKLPLLLVDDILTTGATLTEAARPFHALGLPVVGLVVSSDHRHVST